LIVYVVDATMQERKKCGIARSEGSDRLDKRATYYTCASVRALEFVVQDYTSTDSYTLASCVWVHSTPRHHGCGHGSSGFLSFDVTLLYEFFSSKPYTWWESKYFFCPRTNWRRTFYSSVFCGQLTGLR